MRARARAAAAPVGLAMARLRAAPARMLLVLAGVAVAVAVVGVAVGGGGIAGARAAQRLQDEAAAGDRRVTLTWSGGLTPGGAQEAERALAAAGAVRTPARAVLLRPIRLGHPPVLVQPAAIAPLGAWTELVRGRLPRRCDPRRCEVLHAGGPSPPRVVRHGRLRLVVVGAARLTSRVPLGFRPSPQRAAARPDERPALLLGGEPGALEDDPTLATVYRTHTWGAGLDAHDVASWELDGLAARLERLRARLAAGSGWSATTSLPLLAAAEQRAATARDRVTLVATGGGLLLLAFAVLVAQALRRDARDEAARLDRHGAGRAQRAVLALAEAAAPVGAGVLLGAAVAVAVTWIRAAAAGLDARGLVAHALVTPSAAAGAAALGLGALLLVAAAAADGGWARRAADGVAVAAATATVAILAAGGAQAEAVASGSDPLAALVPALVTVATGLVLARVLPPALGGLGRLARHAPVAARTALLGATRAPGATAATVAFVAVSAGSGLFALAYAATLREGDRAQAAFAVPLDVDVTAGPDFVAPLDLATAARWRALAAGADVMPVLRRSATVARGPATAALPLLGVAPGTLPRLPGWSRTAASAPARELERRLAGGAPHRQVTGPEPPRDARTVALPARTRGDAVRLTLHVRTATDRTVSVRLGRTGPRRAVLRARLPGAARGGRVLALEATPPSGLLATAGHALAESVAGAAVIAGRLAAGPLRSGDERVPLGAWTGGGALQVRRARRAGVVATYAFDRDGPALLRPPGDDGRGPVPVLADPATAAAARDGVLPLRVDGLMVTARVVGTARRMPGVPPGAAGFLVADLRALRAALDARRPGAGDPGELWIAAGPEQERRLAAALRGPRLDGLRAVSRRAVEARLRTDPLAVELLRVLLLAAVAAGVLAIVALVLATGVALRDETAQLRDLEAQGAEPATLRRVLWLRGCAIGALGLVAGAALGTALAAVAAEAVQATAATTPPHPPPTAVLPPGAWAAWAAVLAVAGAAAVRAPLVRAFREDAP